MPNEPSADIAITPFFDEPTETYSYVVADQATGTAAILDPVLDFDQASGRTETESAEKLLSFLKDNDLNLKWILETHAHADHLSSAHFLRDQSGAAVVIGAHIPVVQATFRDIFNLGADFPVAGQQFDRLVADGDRLELGDTTIRVMHTPGHTPACVTYLIGDAAFIGDTLFMPDYGTARCDFPGGDAATLYHSVQRLYALPDTTRLYMCHDYAPGGRPHQYLTTVAEQRAGNIHIHQGIGEAEFVAMRQARDATLDMPRLILPSIQVNIRAGAFPEAEENGVSYLKLPLNML